MVILVYNYRLYYIFTYISWPQYLPPPRHHLPSNGWPMTRNPSPSLLCHLPPSIHPTCQTSPDMRRGSAIRGRGAGDALRARAPIVSGITKAGIRITGL